MPLLQKLKKFLLSLEDVFHVLRNSDIQIGLVGLAGNVVCIAILSRPQMRSSINLILCALSCFDIVVISTSMMMLR